MAGADCEAIGTDTRIYPYYLYWIFRNSVFLYRYLAQPIYSRESLGPFPKQRVGGKRWRE